MMLKRVYLKEIKTWIILLRAKITWWNFTFKESYIMAAMRWRKTSWNFLNNVPFSLEVPYELFSNIAHLTFLEDFDDLIKAHIQGFQMKYQSFFNPKFWLSNSWFSDFMQYRVQFVFSTPVFVLYLMKTTKRDHSHVT